MKRLDSLSSLFGTHVGVAVVLLIALGGAPHAQDSCLANCKSSDSPCAGLQGRKYAQCLARCKEKCHPRTPPAPLLDPRCGDRTATGKFVCTIEKPVVTRPDTEYRAVQFAPGDTVYVNADGCVQTGGFGSTWKRYVNPDGAESEHLYHGLVRIPTARLAGTDVGNSLTRIKNVVGRSIAVTGEGVPESGLVLHLGYEDDNLSDNGYDRHDDGTEDQCKGDHGNDGGPAHVTITICRKVQCGPVGSRFDFDVLSSSVDPNGFLLNPHWSWQDRPGNHGQIPSTSLCHDFSKHDLGRPPKPSFSDCTDQTDLDSVDTPDGANWAACTTPKVATAVLKPPFAGHVNWFPITVEGHVGTITHEWKDDDYDFSLESCDKSLMSNCDQQDSLYTNGRGYLHVEFDSDETIDHFGSDAWVDLRANVNSGTNDSVRRRFAGHTIMTGLFCLDGEHELKSELHPLYAMATRPEKFEWDPSDEVWLIFARNRGDEGYCSSQIWDGGFEDYTFRLPWRVGMISVEVNWDKTQFEGTPGTSTVPTVRVVRPAPGDAAAVERRSRSRATTASGNLTTSGGIYEPVTGGDAGVYVTFHLGHATTLPPGGTTWGPPASIPYIDGELHLIWTGPSSNLSRTAAGGLSRPRLSGTPTAVATERITEAADETDEAEHRLEAAINHLPPRQRMLLQESRVIASPPMPSVHRMSRGGPVEVVTAAPATGAMARSAGPHAPIAGRAGPANQKLARDAAQMRALCAVTNNAPFGLPPEVCKANVRDHRTTPVRDHQ